MNGYDAFRTIKHARSSHGCKNGQQQLQPAVRKGIAWMSQAAGNAFNERGLCCGRRDHGRTGTRVALLKLDNNPSGSDSRRPAGSSTYTSSWQFTRPVAKAAGFMFLKRLVGS